jgi:hypothetical protein
MPHVVTFIILGGVLNHLVEVVKIIRAARENDNKLVSADRLNVGSVGPRLTF